MNINNSDDTSEKKESKKTVQGLDWSHPLIHDWFVQKFRTPTEPQLLGWPSILAGTPTLISAPTGSGKTLAAFLACLDGLVRQALLGVLADTTTVLYVSPLKALSNDVQKNLAEPLTEITHLAKQQNRVFGEIRVSVRTGDTLMRERQSMLKKPPHILVTTPESLYILLTAEKSRIMLSSVNTVIIDEIHALAGNKRGAHLLLSLERLEALTSHPIQRIGLSATQKPLDLVAHFLTGNHRSKPAIINIGHAKHLDLAVEIPASELGPVASNEMWDEIYQRLAELSQEHHSTLIFVNTRRLSERIAHHLTLLLGENQVAAHHGSLSRKLRLAVETKLKKGELKILVATASLELGIDIGSIDLVCQIGSPRAIATMLQRIGRAGHWRGAISKGRIFATTRDELLECAALIKAIREGDLDQLIIPEQPIDILAQQIVATCATGDWQENELFELIKKAYPYTHLSYDTFNQVLEMLSEGIAGSQGRYGTYLLRDRIHHRLTAKRGSRLTAITNGGAIPETGLFSVIAQPDGIMVGTLDEDFAVESNHGDIILLGTTSWKILRVEGAAGRILVEDAHGCPPNVPFWRGEAPARTYELSLKVAELREELNQHLPKHIPIVNYQHKPEVLATIIWLEQTCGLNQSAAEQLIEYILQGRAVLGAVPTQKIIIAERFFDESGGMQLLIHAPFGARINKAWGLALRKRFCRSFNFELQAAATDNGLNIALAMQHSFPLMDVFHFLHSNSVREVVLQAVLQSPLFTTRWRWVATRSLALTRFRYGKKVPPNILRMRADDLLAAIFPDAAACQDNLGGRDIELPNHPLVNETMKDVLNEALDIEGLIEVLKKIETKEIRCIAIDTTASSPFSHEILNANPYAYLDDAPLEERRARAVSMRRILPDTVLEGIGKLDPEAIAEIQQQAWPDIRNADELHDMLQTVIVFPENCYIGINRHVMPEWHNYFQELLAHGRAGIAYFRGNTFWLAVEKAKSFTSLFPDAILPTSLATVETDYPEHSKAVLNTVQGWLFQLGPTNSHELCSLLLQDIHEIENALLQLEASGNILRGNFTFSGQPPTTFTGQPSSFPASFTGQPSHQGQPHIKNSEKIIEWCERRLLARIHHRTLSQLRKSIQPVTATQFMRWLLNWQHVAPGTQLKGESGLLEVIRQLQGFEIPANAWEKFILAKRVTDYNPQQLDHLCLSGMVGWGRISPHPTFLEQHQKTTKLAFEANKQDGANKVNEIKESKPSPRITPTSITPITFFIREEMDWILDHKKNKEMNLSPLSTVAKNIYSFLQDKGACFFADIVRGTKHLQAEIENGLWELVAAGLATADGFDNLRALINPRRRLGQGRERFAKPRYSTGRWSLLDIGFNTDLTKDFFSNSSDPSDSSESLNFSHHLEALCLLLLKRYGVVFRDLLAREALLPRWRKLLITFRRLEDRGEIRAGRFVDGFLGEQFALPYAVESLRAIKKQELDNQAIEISALDPLNLVGIILPGNRLPSISGKKVQFLNGTTISHVNIR